MFLPERLRQARVEAGLTQAELAERLGAKSQALISKYESGAVEPPGRVVAQIAAITGKPRRWFVEKGVSPLFQPHFSGRSFDPDEPPVPPGLQQMIDLGVALRADELQRLVAYADPRNTSRGARAAMSWTAADWLNVLLEERRRQRP
jgi:transcriptional regulator with XRE-family HTH domain